MARISLTFVLRDREMETKVRQCPMGTPDEPLTWGYPKPRAVARLGDREYIKCRTLSIADNLSRRDIPHFIDGNWRDWHAFRRGLGTRLNESVDDSEIQQILRHANVATTTAYYILPNIERAKAGIKKLGAVAQKKYGIRV